MTIMIIYPAIDLRDGKVVRLKEGDPKRQTVFSDNPIDVAKQWIDQGAEWIHMVNLDGAFEETNDNAKILEAVAKLDIKIQFGGGLRSKTAVQKALSQGADRAVVGTAAIETPQLIDELIDNHDAEHICIALDARDGKIATHGWKNITDQNPIDFGRKIANQGVIHALYTDVNRDGSLIGVNVHETITLGRETGLKVIASGGVSQMEEIHDLARSKVVAGAIIGMALYEEQITLAEALLAAKER